MTTRNTTDEVQKKERSVLEMRGGLDHGHHGTRMLRKFSFPFPSFPFHRGPWSKERSGGEEKRGLFLADANVGCYR